MPRCNLIMTKSQIITEIMENTNIEIQCSINHYDSQFNWKFNGKAVHIPGPRYSPQLSPTRHTVKLNSYDEEVHTVECEHQETYLSQFINITLNCKIQIST